MTFMAAIGPEDDAHRKPSPIMWEIFCQKLNGNVLIDFFSSFYCGDAAGRRKSETRVADFSADDLLFAENTGLCFTTPENLFIGVQARGSAYTLVGDDSNSGEDMRGDSKDDGWAANQEISERTH